MTLQSHYPSALYCVFPIYNCKIKYLTITLYEVPKWVNDQLKRRWRLIKFFNYHWPRARYCVLHDRMPSRDIGTCFQSFGRCAYQYLSQRFFGSLVMNDIFLHELLLSFTQSFFSDHYWIYKRNFPHLAVKSFLEDHLKIHDAHTTWIMAYDMHLLDTWVHNECLPDFCSMEATSFTSGY